MVLCEGEEMTFDAKERPDVGGSVASPGCIQVVLLVVWVTTTNLYKICNWHICKSPTDTSAGAAVSSFAGIFDL